MPSQSEGREGGEAGPGRRLLIVIGSCCLQLWSRLDRVWGFFVVKQTTKPHMLASLTARLTFALDLSLVSRLSRCWLPTHIHLAASRPRRSRASVTGSRTLLCRPSCMDAVCQPEPNLAVCCQRLVWDMGLPEHVASSCIALLNHHSSVASMR